MIPITLGNNNYKETSQDVLLCLELVKKFTVVVGGGWWWVLKATLVFIFGPNLKTRILTST